MLLCITCPVLWGREKRDQLDVTLSLIKAMIEWRHLAHAQDKTLHKYFFQCTTQIAQIPDKALSWNGQETFKQEEKLVRWSELVMTQKEEESIHVRTVSSVFTNSEEERHTCRVQAGTQGQTQKKPTIIKSPGVSSL